MGIEAIRIFKALGEQNDMILQDINLSIRDGEFVALTGKSGSGKSTLLYVLSTLDDPTKGELKIQGTNIHSMASPELHEFRNRNIGFVFQFHYLLSELTALENVLMPVRKFGIKPEHREYANHLLEIIGLSDRMNHLPRQMSGGQMQRVAIARSLILQPKYLFADEPTGNLDSENTQLVFDIFKKMNRDRNTTIVIVTHDNDLADSTGRRIVLKDGRLVR